MEPVHLSPRLLLICILMFTALGLLPGGNAPVAARTAVQPTAVWPFQPITLDDAGLVAIGSPEATWLGVSGDWAAYPKVIQSCGHCNPPVRTITLKNLLDGRKIAIQTAILTPGDSNGYAKGATDFEFACDCHNGDPHAGPRLLWTQPIAVPPSQLENFAPGDFTCSRCYYDLATMTGGAWTGGALAPDPPSAYDVSVVPDAQNSADVIKITGHTNHQLLIAASSGPRVRVLTTAVSGDALLYLQTEIPSGPSSAGTQNLVRLVWLGEFDTAFERVWAKADAPVAEGKVPRSWLWGPSLRYRGVEAYAEGLDGHRYVEYYDKSRMEINNPNSDRTNPYFVTNGLLTVEMIGGDIQTGNSDSIHEAVPCTIPVVGDPRKDNPLTPDYSTLAAVASLHGEHQSPNRVGAPVDTALDVHGVVSTDSAHAPLSHYAAFATQTGHNIPDVFWRYLQDMQPTYGFDWTYVLGYPITEGYWTQMRVNGRDLPVLIQAYQRRVLTYTPDFAPNWRIQQGNVGQHYLEWRYQMNK